MRIALVVGATAVALTGCNSVPSDPVDAAIARSAAARPIACKAGPDCEAKWSRVTAWLAANAAYRTQTATDSIIQTMGPLPDNPSAVYTVTKTADASGDYTISLNEGCDNIFGCIPSLDQSRLSLAAFVNGGAPSPRIEHQGKTLGFKTVAVPMGAAASLKLDSDRGMIIAEVEPGGVAATAGLVKGDVVLRVDGQSIDTEAAMVAAINAGAAWHKVTFDISRRGELMGITLPL